MDRLFSSADDFRQATLDGTIMCASEKLTQLPHEEDSSDLRNLLSVLIITLLDPDRPVDPDLSVKKSCQQQALLAAYNLGRKRGI